MRVLNVFATRPEAIKMAPVIAGYLRSEMSIEYPALAASS